MKPQRNLNADGSSSVQNMDELNVDGVSSLKTAGAYDAAVPQATSGDPFRPNLILIDVSRDRYFLTS